MQGDLSAFGAFAPYLRDPLVLVGFFLFLAFLLTRSLLRLHIIPPLPPGRGYLVLKSILLYGFVIGLVLILLGFGLKFFELQATERTRQAEITQRRLASEAAERTAKAAALEREQVRLRAEEARRALEENVVTLLRGELQSNLQTTNELRLNAVSLLNVFVSMATVLRTPGIKVLQALFPIENTQPSSTVGALELADKALEGLTQSGLRENEVEGKKFVAAAQAVRGTIKRTASTAQSMSDLDGVRYRVRSEIWDQNQEVLREVKGVDLAEFHSTYAALRSLRVSYDLVVRRVLDYLGAVDEFLSNAGLPVERQGLAKVLASERLAASLLDAYGKQFAGRISDLRRISRKLTASPGRSGP